MKLSEILSGLKLCILMLIFTSAEATNYYWVGGSGNWTDFSTHWATTSGGGTFHTQVPTPNDNVYFDGNSFTGSGQTVTLDNTLIECKDMDWTGATGSPNLAGSSSNVPKIFGSFTLISAMNISYPGEIYFSSTSTGNTITTAGQLFNEDLRSNCSRLSISFEAMLELLIVIKTNRDIICSR